MSKTLKERCIENDNIEFLTNVLKFNRELMDLNIKYEEEIKRLNNEIERLNNKVEELMTLYTTERNAKEDYEVIIKEVREYIDYYGITPEQNDDVLLRHILKHILEILDKE